MEHKNSDELHAVQKNMLSPSADLWCRKGNTYCGRSAEEGRCRSLVKFRLMQRPSSMKTRCAVATAAELKWQMGAIGRRCGMGRMKEDLVGSIYKEGLLKERQKRGGQKYKLSNYKDALIFGMVIKIKIRWDTLNKTCIYGKWHHGGSPQIQRMTSWRVTKIS